MGCLHYRLGELETTVLHQHPVDGEMCVISSSRSPSEVGFWIRVGGLGGLSFIHLKQSLRTSLLGGRSPLLVQETVPVRRWAVFRCPSPIWSLPVGAVLRGEETTRGTAHRRRLKLQALKKDWFQMLYWDAGSSFCLPAGSRVETRRGGRQPGLSLASELWPGHQFFLNTQQKCPQHPP